MDASQIDWQGIRAAALALGIREAARQAAAHLSPADAKRLVDRIRKRAEREHWRAVVVTHPPVARPVANVANASPDLPDSPTNRAYITPNASENAPRVATGAEIVARTLASRRDKSALALSKYVLDASRALSRSRGDLARAKAGESVARIRANVWPETQSVAAIEITLTERERAREIQARVRALLA